jgi:predicted TIM-barrel fold metal-dependent hydrolase
MPRPPAWLLLLLPALASAQAWQPKIIDAHVHHNGEITFLRRLVTRLRAADAMALLITAPKDLDSVASFVRRYPTRLAGLGEIKLDDPNAVEMVDRFHAAGFPGLGELTRPLKNYDDRSYWPIYARAENYRMILLFHTGIVNRPTPEVPEDVSIDRMRPATLDAIARRFPGVTIIGAHLGNPDYAYAAEIARWNPNLYFDLSGSTLIKKQEDYTFFKSLFWWSSVVSPHTPKSKASAFEKVVFGSDVFNGELEEFDRTLDRYRKMLDACGVAPEAQANIFVGTMWRILKSRPR